MPLDFGPRSWIFHKSALLPAAVLSDAHAPQDASVLQQWGVHHRESMWEICLDLPRFGLLAVPYALFWMEAQHFLQPNLSLPWEELLPVCCAVSQTPPLHFARAFFPTENSLALVQGAFAKSVLFKRLPKETGTVLRNIMGPGYISHEKPHEKPQYGTACHKSVSLWTLVSQGC